jgi:hypothetical protein
MGSGGPQRWLDRFLLSTPPKEPTKRGARCRGMSQELIVIAPIIAAAFGLGFFTGFAVRASISHRRRRYSRR